MDSLSTPTFPQLARSAIRDPLLQRQLAQACAELEEVRPGRYPHECPGPALSEREGALDFDPLLVESIESLADGFAIFDNYGRPLVFNAVTHRRFSNVYRAMAAGASYMVALMVALAVARPQDSAEKRVRFAEGMHGCFDRCEPYEVFSEDGRFCRISYKRMSAGYKVALSVDLTDVHAREKELQRLQQVAVAASDQVGLSGNMSLRSARR